MAWSATLVSVTHDSNNCIATVRFTDSTTNETFDIPYQADNISSTALEQIVKNRLTSLTSRDAAVVALTPFIGQTIAAPPGETPAQIAADTFFADLVTLKSAQLAISLGIITSANATYAALLAKVQGEFLASYVTDPRFR